MLYLLTGDRQIGKTRWLERAISTYTDYGYSCYGIMTPGVWEEMPNGNFEKQGIFLRLLPDEIAMPFANPAFDERTGLGWTIDTCAIDKANEFVKKLSSGLQNSGFENPLESKCGARSTNVAESTGNKIFICDELGPLEFYRHEGFTETMALIDSGCQSMFKDVILIIRPELVEEAKKRWNDAWRGMIRIIIPEGEPADVLSIEHL